MTSVPGVDHPVEQTEAEVTLSGRGISVTARVAGTVEREDPIEVAPAVERGPAHDRMLALEEAFVQAVEESGSGTHSPLAVLARGR